MDFISDLGRQVRIELLKLSRACGGYHYGGSLSCVEILIALSTRVLQTEDKFIISKGHGAWGWYVLMDRKGKTPVAKAHPERDVVNGIDWSTGSLGHGFPVAIGMALGKKLNNEYGRVYVLLGDGECQEGTTWESLLLANRLGLNNLTVIVDCNKAQGSGFTEQILPVITPLTSAAQAADWCISYVNGHSVLALENTLPKIFSTPHLVIANTIKGAGVSYMENVPEWHAKWPNDEQFERALQELAIGPKEGSFHP